ncbi:MAG: hypothetical protein M3O30_07925 [Planctomycetota bacterium]|nr:hypothetical protein [Planctomycetota bacterium]
MANQPLSKEEAPDPSRSYERSRPEDEAGMGKLSVPKAPVSKEGDRMHHAVGNRQEFRQINAEEVPGPVGAPAAHATSRETPKTQGVSEKKPSRSPKQPPVHIERPK